MTTTTYTCADARCPRCRCELTGATDMVNDSAPSGGDISVCAYCGAIMVFNPDLTLREATHGDIDALSPDLAWKLGQFVGAVHMRLREERQRHGTH